MIKDAWHFAHGRASSPPLAYKYVLEENPHSYAYMGVYWLLLCIGKYGAQMCSKKSHIVMHTWASTMCVQNMVTEELILWNHDP